MPYFKRPGVQMFGRPHGRGAEFILDADDSFTACAIIEATLRGNGSGGGGCVYGGPGDEQGDGERGLAGTLISDQVRRTTPVESVYDQNNRGLGGGRTVISGESGSADDGGDSQASSFLDLVTSIRAGGRGAFWDNFDNVTQWPNGPALVTNPDGSDAGRGGFGGQGALSQSGLSGQYGKLFLKIIGF